MPKASRVAVGAAIVFVAYSIFILGGRAHGFPLAAIDDPASGLAPGLRMKLRAAKDYMIAAQPVVRVATDLAIPSHDAALPTKPADPSALVELSDRWRPYRSLAVSYLFASEYDGGAESP